MIFISISNRCTFQLQSVEVQHRRHKIQNPVHIIWHAKSKWTDIDLIKSRNLNDWFLVCILLYLQWPANIQTSTPYADDQQMRRIALKNLPRKPHTGCSKWCCSWARHQFVCWGKPFYSWGTAETLWLMLSIFIFTVTLLDFSPSHHIIVFVYCGVRVLKWLCQLYRSRSCCSV